MIYQNAIWYDILPSDLSWDEDIAGKWLYFDDTQKIHALLEDLDRLVEAGDIRAAKVARKLPEFDPFPENSCVLCVFTSNDPNEKKRVKKLLKDRFDISVVCWKSDRQTERDWQNDGWLHMRSEINWLRRDIETSEASDVQAAQQRILTLTEQLENIIADIEDPNQQLELQLVEIHQLKKQNEESLLNRDASQEDVLERLARLERLITEMASKTTTSEGEHQALQTPLRPMEQKRIKILFLTANTLDTSRLRLDKEIREIDRALRQADFHDKFDIEQHWAVRVADLQGYLLRHKPHIVHFSGHGSQSSEIILEDNFGKSAPVSIRALSKLFSVLKDNIRCVVLNACYSEKQAQAIAEHIDCVIGMSKAIGDTSAISFASAFYQALGFGRNIQTAFDLGCLQIDLDRLGEQATPKLIAHRTSPDGIVLVEQI
jgi:hypothetical protein